MDNEGLICLSDMKEKWLLTCAIRHPDSKMQTQSFKRMMRKYQCAAVPVKTDCVVIDSDRTVRIEDPMSLVSLGQWLLEAGFALAERQNWSNEDLNTLGDGLFFYMDQEELEEDDEDPDFDFMEEL